MSPNHRPQRIGRLFVVVGLTVTFAAAHAHIVVGGTRVIYREKDREASIPVKNTGSDPYVVQAWIDAGEETKVKTPFVLTPPLSRLDPGMENLLRIIRSAGHLAGDRESVFWLNVKEIPEKPKAQNVLQIAIRTRIKLFYRPAALQGDPLAARSLLKWAVVPGANGTGAALKVANTSAYHVTFAGLSVDEGKQEIGASMIAPFEQSIYPLTGLKVPRDVHVAFTTINDYGGETPREVAHVLPGSQPTSVELKAAPAQP